MRAASKSATSLAVVWVMAGQLGAASPDKVPPLATSGAAYGEKAGAAPSAAAAGTPRPKHITELKPPFAFSIQAIDLNGNPQAGVKIRCLHPRSERGPALVDLVAVTDAQGIARFRATAADLLRDRYYWFSVVEDGFICSARVGISPIDEEFEWTFRVAPSEEFAFRVLDEHDLPVPKAKLTLWVAGTTALTATATAGTDQGGWATLRFARVKADIMAVAENRAPTVVLGADLDPDQHFPITLGAGFDLVGSVVLESSNTLPRARLVGQPAGFRHADAEELTLRAETDSSGRFTFHHVTPGQYEVWAHFDGPDQPWFAYPVTVRLGEDGLQEPILIKAVPGAVLTGKYVAEPPLGLAKRPIHLTLFGPRRVSWQSESKADGSFVLHLPGDAQGEIRFESVAGYYLFVKLPTAVPGLAVSAPGIRFSQVPAGAHKDIRVEYSLMGVADVTVADKEGKVRDDLAILVRPGATLYRAARTGKYKVEIPSGQEARLEVWDGLMDKLLLQAPPFTIRPGEIVERRLVLP